MDVKILIFFIFNLTVVSCGIGDYVNQITSYFGSDEEKSRDEFYQKVPYEVSSLDEKFISEASKLNQIALSGLDSCQQRVIFKLKKECGKLNDEDLAKLAVHLLNCQSYVEGRKTYPCTDEMSLKSCTKDMDADTWTAYHIMSNRARAVCYIVRQSQFRGIAEITVNRLMDAAQVQIGSLDKIIANQQNLRETIVDTQETLVKGNEDMMQQQKDLQQAQLYGQLAIEQNIQSLVKEKKMIAETHNQLLTLTKGIRTTLEGSSALLNKQNHDSTEQHNRLTTDLNQIQYNIADILKKIEDSGYLLNSHNEEFNSYSEETLKNLIEVNRTVHNLITMVNGTRQVLEEKIYWLGKALGGTDMALDRLYIILWHIGFILMAMLCCAFLKVPIVERLLASVVPIVNLVMALNNKEYLDAGDLLITILACTAVHILIVLANNYLRSRSVEKRIKVASYAAIDRKYKSEDVNDDRKSEKSESEQSSRSELKDDFDWRSPTPPLSRNSFTRSKSRTPSNASRSLCSAKTRQGSQCKLASRPEAEYCFRHIRGDSVY